MILFCEECGRKSLVEQSEQNVSDNGFVCHHCGFRTPAAAIAHMLKKNLVWTPNPLIFKMTGGDKTVVQHIVFQELNDAPIQIESLVIDSLQYDLQTRAVDAQTIAVELLPLGNRIRQHGAYKGEAIHCRNLLSDFSCVVKVEFNRDVPCLSGMPEKVDLGVIPSNGYYHNQLLIENSGNDTLSVQVRTEPMDFSIAARFVLEGSLALRLAPKERKMISYFLWPVADISEDWDFVQRIYVKTNEPGKQGNRKVVIHGKIVV